MSGCITRRLRSNRAFVFVSGRLCLIDYQKGNLIELDSSYYNDLDSTAAALPYWNSNRAWLSWRKRIRYIEYWDAESVLQEDYEANLSKHQTNTQPNLVRDNFGSQSIIDEDIVLPVPFLTDGSFLSKLSSILFLGFGAVDTVKFHEDHVLLKNTPSVGARHGLEAYILHGGNEYYYDCLKHKLVCLRYADTNEPLLSRMIICLRAECYMWRYEHGECLYDVYMDLGHIVANLAIGSELFGIVLKESSEDNFIEGVSQTKMNLLVYELC